jgi:hypothetical protein
MASYKLRYSLSTVERFLEKDFETAIRDAEYHDKISIVGDKMRMNKELMLSLFETTKVNIILEIRNVLEQLPTTNLKTFLLVLGIGLRFLLPHVFGDHAWIRQILAEYAYHRYTA